MVINPQGRKGLKTIQKMVRKGLHFYERSSNINKKELNFRQRH